eukprot:TRINITY_DN3742_c0_g1_i8.p1 TRINITY_DN3742_c0_g1~~TRINITY_DN3742_c0_g1_i8.p1  ORF type:complete len:1306 (+),score=473.82 TRINITY_DN3742_c0_g1_i8:83-4000(+)
MAKKNLGGVTKTKKSRPSKVTKGEKQLAAYAKKLKLKDEDNSDQSYDEAASSDDQQDDVYFSSDEDMESVGSKPKKLSQAIRRNVAEDDMEDDDSMSLPDPGASFAEAIQKRFRVKSNMAPHDLRVSAVFSAVTAVIQEKKGELIPASYFAVLLQSLVASETHDKPEEVLSATLPVLSFVLPRVSSAVIKVKFQDLARVLLILKERHQANGSSSLLKSLISCAGGLLAGAQDPSIWSNSDFTQLFQGILLFTKDSRPKVRREAQFRLGDVLSNCPSNTARNTVSLIVSQFFHKVVNQFNAAKHETQQSVLYALDVIKGVFPLLSGNSVPSICESLFKLLNMKQPMLTALVMQSLESLFQNTDETSPTKLSVDLVSKVIASLFEFQPNLSDTMATNAFAKVMTAAFVQYHSLDEKGCANKLADYFTTLFLNFSSTDDAVAKCTVECFRVVIGECIDDALISQAWASLNNKQKGTETSKSPLRNIIDCLAQGAEYQYRDVWPHTFEVFASLFDQLASKSDPLLIPLLQTIDGLYNPQEHAQADFADAIQVVFGSAVAAIGPEKYFQAVPLNLFGEDKTSPTRGYLLPLFKKWIVNTRLEYFVRYFLPLAAQLKEKAALVLKAERPVEAKNLSIVYHHVWDLLPAFCRHPTDIPKAFPMLAKTLGTALTDEPSLRNTICTALIYLITESRDALNTENADEDDSTAYNYDKKEAQQNVNAIAAFCKNFLPVMFNLYGVASDNHKSKLEEAIGAFVSISEPKLMNSMFKNVLAKLLQAPAKPETNASMEVDSAAQKTTNTKENLLELMVPFVPHLDETNLDVLIKTITPHLEDKIPSLQKKAFKVLQTICEHHTSFVLRNFDSWRVLLTDSLVSGDAPTKMRRLRCLEKIFDIKSESTANKQSINEIIIPTVIGDVLLCCKELNAKTRNAAFDVLGLMAEKMRETGSIQDYLSMIVAGLAGVSGKMKGATIISLTHLIYQFQEEVDQEFVHQLLKPILTLWDTPDREVTNACFNFVKVMLVCQSPEFWRPHLEEIVSKLVAFGNVTDKNKSRMNVRNLFQKLIRKFGYDEIEKLIPEQDLKLIANIRRTEKRALKKRKQGKADIKGKRRSIENILNDEESEDDEHEVEEKPKKSKKTAAWLIENGEEPMDFADPKSMRGVTTSNPSKKQKKVRKVADEMDTFDFDPTGKIIVPDDKADPNAENKSSVSNYDSMMAEHDEEFSKKTKKNKRKHAEDEESEEEEDNKRSKHINTSYGKKGKKEKVDKNKHFGEEYRSKRAGGDMKRQGKADPFAYIPLNGKLLNKRKAQGYR